MLLCKQQGNLTHVPDSQGPINAFRQASVLFLLLVVKADFLVNICNGHKQANSLNLKQVLFKSYNRRHFESGVMGICPL